jgi:hypothetical protein
MAYSTMDQKYQDFIVSTNEKVTFLHRCSRDSLDSILKEGLSYSADINSTATAQPENLAHAEKIYHNGASYGSSVAVIQFPRELYDQTPIKSGNNILSKDLAYFHPVRKSFTVKPEFVIAWIDRNTNQVRKNPYKNRKPLKGHEEFEDMFN